MREGGGIGGCLFQILFILAILALIGVVDWSTVGDWVIFMVSILVVGIGGLILFMGYAWLVGDNDNEN